MTGLPPGWTSASVDELARGGLFCDGDWVESKDQDSSGGIRLTQLADVGIGAFRDRSDRWMRADQAERLRCTYLQPGDVLVARMPEPLGRSCTVPESIGEAVTAVDVAVVRIARPDVNPRFLMWALNSPEMHQAMVSVQSGTTRRRISRKNLGRVRIPLPSIQEQRRIVDILEDHLSRLDAADALTIVAEAKLDAWRRGCIDQLVWGSRDSRVPLSSLLWEPMRNGHSARATRDGSGIRTLSLTAVTRGHFSEQFTKMTTADPRKVAGLWLRSGDILVERSNTPELVGTAALYDGPDNWAVYPDLVIRVRVDPSRALPGYVAGAIRSERAHRWLRSRAKGLAGSMPKIDQGTIGALELPISSLDDQAAVAAQVDGVEIDRDRLLRESQAARRRAVALRRSLLQSAFSGRLTGASTDIEIVEEVAGV